MKVKEILDAQIEFTDAKVNVVVKPKGTKKEYYNSEVHLKCNLRNEVAEMEVKSWFVCNAKKNQCNLIIIVERDESYEADRENVWKDLIAK